MLRLSLLTAAIVAVTSVAATTCRPPKWTVGQTVQTTSGPVDGHAASEASGVSEYLGIPYAVPPLGHLRFQPPIRYTGNSKIGGKSFSPACFSSNISSTDADYPQSLAEEYGIGQVGLNVLKGITDPGLPVSEDCLTLNVWTKPQTGDNAKAVMVFVHGGSYVSGGSALPAYNGQFFADQEDVVLVTINYRLTIFGFPGNPSGTQNVGLLDQRLALEWVRDNIAHFGGDPKRITLFGESAGGSSIDHYSFAYASDPIISGLISQSGTAQGIVPLPATSAATLWYTTTTAVGCGNASTSTPASILACMQALPARTILSTLYNTITTPFHNPYSPTIDNTTVFSVAVLNASHPATRVPLLIGNNDNENGLFHVFVPAPNISSFWEGQNLKTFVCPAAARANRSLADANPTWRYRWFGVFPNTVLSPTLPSGAYHDSETAVLFGNTDQSVVRDTEEEVAVGRYMRDVWAAFARDPVKGLEGYGWPRYVAGEETLVRIGWGNKTGVNAVRGDYYDTGC